MSGRLAASALSALLVATISNAEIHHGEPPSGTVGLLSLPEILGGDAGVCTPSEATAVTLFEAPGGARNGATLRTGPARARPRGGCVGGQVWIEQADGRRTPVWVMEHGYQAVSLIVLEARAPWYRIALPAGSAWVEREGGVYRDLVTLYADGLTYLTTAWDGELCDGPDPERACAVADIVRLHREQQDSVEVLDWAQRPDGLWLEVQLVTSPCRTDVQRRLPIRGWLRAHGRGHVPSVWFHSRGC